jgi:anti-sigma B factor antagonist
MNFIVKAFQPSGILDGINGNQLRRDIISAVETGVDIVLLDLQDVNFMNSAGLGTLLAALRTVKTKGNKIFICSLNEQVKMLFSMTKMERVFEIFANRDEFKSTILSPECQFLENH